MRNLLRGPWLMIQRTWLGYACGLKTLFLLAEIFNNLAGHFPTHAL